ncbi:MAG: AAA family ATPase [Candidatus Paceibacterota bacterium]
MDVAKEADKLLEDDMQAKKATAYQKMHEFPLVPHFVTETKNGFHLIWLTKGIEREWEFLQFCKALAARLDGDMGGMAVNKLLRVPGYYHLKDVKAPFKCELLVDNSSMPRYSREEIAESLSITMSEEENIARSQKASLKEPSQEIQEACQIPVRQAIEHCASEIGMPIDFRENPDGSFQIIENGVETSGFISSQGNFVHSSSGKKREGNAITVTEYYLNELGRHSYNRQEIAEMLIGKYKQPNPALEESEMQEELPIEEFEAIRKRGFPKMEFIVDELIVKGALNMIVGDPGSYKTWFYQYILYCIAYRLPVLGIYKTTLTNALIVNVDDPLPLTMERLEKIGLDENALATIYLWEKEVFTLDLEENTLLERLSEFAEEHKISVVVFDTLRQIHGGDENDSGDMNKVMKNLKNFAVKSGCAVILVHHQRKNDGGYYSSNIQSPSGSIAIMGNIFSSLHLSKTKAGPIKIEKGKSKMNRAMEPFYVVMDSEEKGQSFFKLAPAPEKIDMEVIEEKIRSFYDQNPAPELTRKDFINQFAKDIKVPKKRVEEAFKKLEDDDFLMLDGISRPKNKKCYIKSPDIESEEPGDGR